MTNIKVPPSSSAATLRQSSSPSMRLLSLTLVLLLLTSCSSRLPRELPSPQGSSSSTSESSEASRDPYRLVSKDGSVRFVGRKGRITHEIAFLSTSTVIKREGGELKFLGAEVRIGSLLTDIQALTDHLLSADFFDAEEFPVATFLSTDVTKLSLSRYRISGDLTIKGITKPVSFEAEFTGGDLSFALDLLRGDFGVGEAGGIDDAISLTAEVRF